MAAPLYTTSSGLLWHAGKILIVLVGLPARGKTHISRALERYLRWNGVTTEVFSLGDYRRKTLGHAKDLPKDYFTHGPKSAETEKLKATVREGCEKDILDFFDHAGQVAIYDANNGTKDARTECYTKFHALGYHVIFLESVCDNQDIVVANIRSVKISSPDYEKWEPDRAVEDYLRRIKDHEVYYDPVQELEHPWIRVINVGERIQVNKIEGYLQSRIVFFLMNVHNRNRYIYFARSGQSLIEHSYRADSDLSPAGWDYAKRLKTFMMERRYLNAMENKKDGPVEDRNLHIWTSTRRRSHHTAWPFIRNDTDTTTEIEHPPSDDSPASVSVPPTPPASKPTNPAPQLPYSKIKVVDKSRLCEINPGVWDGLSPDDVRERYPEEWENFLKDPYGHRAPRAESYHDLCVRLEPILIELEHVEDDLLIITHASVIRCLLAYLVGLPAQEVPAVDIARGDLIEVQPSAYGVKTRLFHFWSGPGRKDGPGTGTGTPVGSIPRAPSPPRSNLHLEAVRRKSGVWQPPDLDRHGKYIAKPTEEDVKEEVEPTNTIITNISGEALTAEPDTMSPLVSPPPTTAPDTRSKTAANVLPRAEVAVERGKEGEGGDAHDERPTFYENVVENTANTSKTR